MQVARIYGFGDSIMAGTYDVYGGWFDHFKQDMHQVTSAAQDGTKRQVYNLGIGGETSRGLVKRIESELRARHSQAWPAIICIGIGKNDSRLRKDGSIEVPIEEYEQNLRDIIAIAQMFSTKILLIGIGPCAEDVIDFKDLTYTRKNLHAYNTVMKKVANELSIGIVDIYDLLVQNEDKAFYRDKLHPSTYGYGLIYAAAKPELLRLLEE
jgi:acyl-CoA thioesterase I